MKPTVNTGVRVPTVYNATDTVTVKGAGRRHLKHLLLQLSPDWTSNSCRGACKIVGSPDLKPETSESWELGLYYMGEDGWLEGWSPALPFSVTM